MLRNALQKSVSGLLWLIANILPRFSKKGAAFSIITGPLAGSRIQLHNQQQDRAAFSGRWKKQYLGLMARLIHHRVGLSKDAIIFNIGAGHGFTELFLNRKLAKRCRIYAFEPSAHANQVLTQNLLINHIENTEVIKKAVSHKIGMIDLYETDGHHASVIPGAVPQATARKLVPTTTLDIFCKRNNMAPAFISLNINGGAALALEGAATTVGQYHPLLYVEVHTNEEKEDVAQLTGPHGYEIFNVKANTWVAKDDHDYFFEKFFTGGLLLAPANMKEDINYALFNKYRRDPEVAENWKDGTGKYALN